MEDDIKAAATFLMEDMKPDALVILMVRDGQMTTHFEGPNGFILAMLNTATKTLRKHQLQEELKLLEKALDKGHAF